MNKRERKKKRIGEFQELGFELSCVVNLETDSPEFDKWCDDFLEMIESYGLSCGGGGKADDWSVFVSRYKGSVKCEEWKQIGLWLLEDLKITKFHIGPLVDAWYDTDNNGQSS